MPTWNYLGSGSYNTVYRSTDGQSVLKIQQNASEITDAPLRSVRLWNAINAHVPPPARLEGSYYGLGWVCPYVEGEQASDEEMSEALIDIYNRTGRIIVDATAPKNFVRTPPPNSKIVCVDIGMAMQMEQREETHFSADARRKSIVSLDKWRDINYQYTHFFKSSAAIYPRSIETVKALLFIKNNRPDIFNVSFLKNQPQLLSKLAKAHDGDDNKTILNQLDKETPDAFIAKGKTLPQQVLEAIGLLQEQRALSLENIKESCKVELQRYIDSRGSISKEGIFHPSLITKIFRDEALTAKKVEAARDLMTEINKADSLEEITEILNTELPSDLVSSRFTRGLEATIGKCKLDVEVAKSNINDQLRETKSLGG